MRKRARPAPAAHRPAAKAEPVATSCAPPGTERNRAATYISPAEREASGLRISTTPEAVLLQPPRGLCCRLSLGELALDQVQPCLPEAGIGEVHTDDLPQLLRAARATCGEQLQIAGHHLLAQLLVAVVDGESQELTVGVGVDVAGAADEVRDIGPPGAVALGQLDRVAEHLALALRPQLAEALDRDLSALAT